MDSMYKTSQLIYSQYTTQEREVYEEREAALLKGSTLCKPLYTPLPPGSTWSLYLYTSLKNFYNFSV